MDMDEMNIGGWGWRDVTEGSLDYNSGEMAANGGLPEMTNEWTDTLYSVEQREPS